MHEHPSLAPVANVPSLVQGAASRTAVVADRGRAKYVLGGLWSHAGQRTPGQSQGSGIGEREGKGVVCRVPTLPNGHAPLVDHDIGELYE